MERTLSKTGGSVNCPGAIKRAIDHFFISPGYFPESTLTRCTHGLNSNTMNAPRADVSRLSIPVRLGMTGSLALDVIDPQP
jgi:hypothetical protein